jgi:hypothetical protein
MQSTIPDEDRAVGDETSGVRGGQQEEDEEMEEVEAAAGDTGVRNLEETKRERTPLWRLGNDRICNCSVLIFEANHSPPLLSLSLPQRKVILQSMAVSDVSSPFRGL